MLVASPRNQESPQIKLKQHGSSRGVDRAGDTSMSAAAIFLMIPVLFRLATDARDGRPADGSSNRSTAALTAGLRTATRRVVR
jgi:hypothetical protein